jgi:hypothetical protein
LVIRKRNREGGIVREREGGREREREIKKSNKIAET